MNRSEAFEIKEKYGDEAYSVALEILEKDRIIGHWTEKKNVAEHYIRENSQKIGKLMVKLETAKRTKN